MSWHVLRCAQQDECSNNQNWEKPKYYQLQEVDLLQPLLTILLEIELWGRPVHLSQVCGPYFHDDDDKGHGNKEDEDDNEDGGNDDDNDE